MHQRNQIAFENLPDPGGDSPPESRGTQKRAPPRVLSSTADESQRRESPEESFSAANGLGTARRKERLGKVVLLLPDCDFYSLIRMNFIFILVIL
jgi:hypothetical protein